MEVFLIVFFGGSGVLAGYMIGRSLGDGTKNPIGQKIKLQFAAAYGLAAAAFAGVLIF